jgi:hypothetical protein
MALLDKAQGKLFKAYEASKRRYEAEHDRLMEHIRKYGYEKPMHKNVSQAPVVVAREQEVVEAPHAPILPVRGRMPTPRRAAAEAPLAPPAPPAQREAPDAAEKVSRAAMKKQKQAIREYYGVDVKGANKLYKEGKRVEVPKVGQAMSKTTVSKEVKPRKSNVSMETQTTEPYMEDTKVGVYRKPKEGKETAEMGTQDTPSSRKNVMKEAHALIKKTPGLSIGDAMKQIWAKK